ncbi:MAG: DUF2520 domain-containing protein, partial [Burkholderiaceae bacterium]|nr:DUF2520 domain-containing protein [Burkholderiaceae bacterium]
RLAKAHGLAGVLVFHCSGAKSSAELQAAQDAGAVTASVHPVRSFADPAAVAARFDGTFCGVEGEAAALAVLNPALLAAGARPIAIDAAAKTVYHAAAVFACNYLTTLLDTALRAYQAAGIPEEVARELAQPLVTETVANVFKLGPAQALSGPIARGDFATVDKQRRALARWEPASAALYQALVAPTTALAERKRRRSHA